MTDSGDEAPAEQGKARYKKELPSQNRFNWAIMVHASHDVYIEFKYISREAAYARTLTSASLARHYLRPVNRRIVWHLVFARTLTRETSRPVGALSVWVVLFGSLTAFLDHVLSHAGYIGDGRWTLVAGQGSGCKIEDLLGPHMLEYLLHLAFAVRA